MWFRNTTAPLRHRRMLSAMRTSTVTALCVLAISCAGAQRASQDALKPSVAAAEIAPACAGPERRQFDFWIGDWDVHDEKGTLVGRNQIAAIDGGCALLELWRSARGSSGTSINSWDPVDRQWVQHWVDKNGSVLDMEGERAGETMRLDGRYAKADGSWSRLRGVWTPLSDGRVRQLFEISNDGGQTWAVWFDGFYTRRTVGD